MREILFRGKSNWDDGKVKKGDWLYSMTISRHCYNDEEISSYYIGNGNKTIDGKTLGQYTGLTDKNGTKIFEGDILEFSDRFVVVFWHTHLGCWDSNFLKFTNKENSRDDMSPLNWDNKSKVIGNIHDNPELLGGD